MSISPWQNEEALSDINVTPFVDILLVLLIIFMVTAPIVHHVIEVDLPQDSYSQDEMKPLQEPLRIVIDSSGVMYLGEKRLGASKDPRNQTLLQDAVRQWAKQQKEPAVDIEADEHVRYGEIVPVIARVKELQVGMNLVIRPKPKNR